MIRLRTLLYPTDFSEYADCARPYATDLAKRFGAHILLFHAVEVTHYRFAYGVIAPSHKVEPSDLKLVEQKLQAYAKKIADEGVAVETLCVEGHAFVKILETARSREVDLIVMATRGASAVKQMMLGATAERVVRKAPCPVLTIRRPEDEFAHPLDS